MPSLVCLTNRAPSKFASELILAGYRVLEALTVSEAYHLCAQEHVDLIVIGPGVQSPNLEGLKRSHITIQLNPETTAKDLIWELSHLYSSTPRPLQ